MSAQKQKGTWWETACVNFLNQHGYICERRALSGVLDKGDVSGVPGVVFECKNAKRIDLAGWLKETQTETINADADLGFLWIHRKGKASPGDAYVVMTGHQLVKLLAMAGYQPERGTR